MRRSALAASLALLAVSSMTLAACSRGEEPTAAAAGAVALPHGGHPVQLDPNDFSTTIDHRYWPLEPRTRLAYREDDGEGQVLQVRVTVTTATKKMPDGITARVVRDTVVDDSGQLVEDTFDYYAQDADGAVWYLGEQTAEFEDGRVSSRAGSFLAGAHDAQPGLLLPAQPEVGQTYRQEYRAGSAEDQGAVLALDEMADTLAGHFEHALLTRDTTPLEPRVLEYKLYAPGVGLVLTLDASGGHGREELVGVRTVSGREAAAAGSTPLGRPY